MVLQFVALGEWSQPWHLFRNFEVKKIVMHSICLLNNAIYFELRNSNSLLSKYSFICKLNFNWLLLSYHVPSCSMSEGYSTCFHIPPLLSQQTSTWLDCMWWEQIFRFLTWTSFSVITGISFWIWIISFLCSTMYENCSALVRPCCYKVDFVLPPWTARMQDRPLFMEWWQMHTFQHCNVIISIV
jgi:hypothetical protein